MEMSKAAIAPRQPAITPNDRTHPLLPLYNQHRAFCSNNLLQADGFRDWLSQYEHRLLCNNAAMHPDYPEFMKWMRSNQGGARKCPAGAFPHNFEYWRNGGRW